VPALIAVDAVNRIDLIFDTEREINRRLAQSLRREI